MWLALLNGLVAALRTCFPAPAAGVAALREPPFGLAGIRRLWWANRIRAAVTDRWTGPAAALPAVQAAVLTRVRQGGWPALVGRLYAEQQP